jgi:PKD repeat protein
MKKLSTILLGFATMLSVTAFASTEKQILQLMVTDKNSNQMDISYLYFAPGTQTSYVFPEDVKKNFDTTSTRPQLFTLTSDGVACYSNGFGDFNATTIIALGIRATANSTYSISMPENYNFDGATLMFLEDRATGTMTDLREGAATVQIAQAGLASNRFYLHVTFPPSINTLASGCDNNTGVVAVAQDSSVQWTSCIIFDSAYNRINTLNNVSGNFNFTGLAEGSYKVAFVYNSYRSQQIVSVSGYHIDATVTSSTVHAAVGEQIDFYSSATNATDYKWEMGDSTIITGVANPSYAYEQAGTYTVTLTATNNFSCTNTASAAVYVSQTSEISNVNSNDVTIANANNNIRIMTTETGSKYSVYAVSGQLLRQGAVTSTDFTVGTSNLSNGIYMVTVKSNEGSYTKKIMVAR